MLIRAFLFVFSADRMDDIFFTQSGSAAPAVWLFIRVLPSGGDWISTSIRLYSRAGAAELLVGNGGSRRAPRRVDARSSSPPDGFSSSATGAACGGTAARRMAGITLQQVRHHRGGLRVAYGCRPQGEDDQVLVRDAPPTHAGRPADKQEMQQGRIGLMWNGIQPLEHLVVV